MTENIWHIMKNKLEWLRVKDGEQMHLLNWTKNQIKLHREMHLSSRFIKEK